MSAECFRVDLLGSKPPDAVAYLAGLELITPRGSDYGHSFIYDDHSHVVELLVQTDRLGRALISIRFALCHPSSVDNAFVQFVVQVAAELGMTIRICESIPPGHPDVFDLSEVGAFRTTALASIGPKRAWWISAFGGATAALTSEEASRQFILGE